ncbi:MAG: hypothetical protein KI792_03650 [Alphaproteobacteria bacterium]|nr:hypothetical protein [Alphaproteobacteria bacterium SS10]
MLVIVVCIGIAAGATLAMREARSAKCPCFASAAMVRLTGTTITVYTQAWIAWTYILLAFNFSALNAQISGNTQADTEMGSHHLSAYANNRRQALAYRQNIRQQENPDHSFQATVASVSGVIDADQMTHQAAILEENVEWLRGLTRDTSNSTRSANAQWQNQRTEDEYCGDRLAEITGCTVAEEGLKDADSRAETLVGYSVVTERFRDASIDFCRSVVGSAPPQVLSTVMTPERYQRAHHRETYTARMALVFQTCQYMAGIRAETDSAETNAWAERMRALTSGLADGVPDYLSERSPGAEGSSFFEMLRFAASYRATNPRWFTLTQALGDSASVWQQIAAIRATTMFLRWQRFEVQQMQAGLIAGIQAAETNTFFVDKTNDSAIAPVDF